MLVVSHISSLYNKSSQRGWVPFFIKGGEPMSAYEIIMIVLGILTVVISFGALIVQICRNNDK